MMMVMMMMMQCVACRCFKITVAFTVNKNAADTLLSPASKWPGQCNVRAVFRGIVDNDLTDACS